MLFPCPAVSNGIHRLAQLAASVYGNGKHVQYMDHEGVYHETACFAVLLQNAHLTQQEGRAAAALRQADIPEDGVKTALLLLDALLMRGQQAGCTAEAWARIGDLLAYGEAYLPRIAHENGGALPGGGLFLLTLAAPIRKYARGKGGSETAVLTRALAQPLLALAETAGADGCEVYERVKALAPNQFFSLYQVGIERSISTDSPHTDFLRMGLDPADGKIKDLSQPPHCVELAANKQMLAFVRRALSQVLNIAAVI